MLSRLGNESLIHKRTPPPITLPKLNLGDLDDETIEAEARAAAAKVKTIRAGIDAWAAINRAASFESWLRVGAALSIGRRHALKVTQANAPMGRRYSREFGEWIKQHGFERMPAPTRSVAVELHENAAAITSWRDSLPERQRKRLVHPLSVTRRWRASTTHNGKTPTDLRRDAKAALARFCALVRALPADEARPLWESVAAKAAIEIAPQTLSNKKALPEGAACGP